MRSVVPVFAFLPLLLLLAGAAPAGYEFAERGDPAVGWTWVEQVRWHTLGHTKVVMRGITVRDKTRDEATSYRCTVEVRALEGAVPSELELRFDETTWEEDGEKGEVGLAGYVVRATGLGDDRSFRTADGGRLKRKLRKFLERQFGENGDDDDPVELLLPVGPVQIGDTWAMDMDKIVEYLGRERFELDEAASTAAASLLGVVERDGVQYGQIRFRVVIVPSAITDGTFTEARMALEGTAELPLAGDLPFKVIDVKLELRYLGSVTRKRIKVDLDLDTTATGVVRLDKPS